MDRCPHWPTTALLWCSRGSHQTRCKACSPFLPSCLPWVPLVRGWRHITQQHDAAEFMQHLLARSAPSAHRGCWQSRLANPMQVVDAGRLASPLPMDLAGDDLQSVVDGWAAQHAPHALVGHQGVIVLQLKRYHSEAELRSYHGQFPYAAVPADKGAVSWKGPADGCGSHVSRKGPRFWGTPDQQRSRGVLRTRCSGRLAGHLQSRLCYLLLLARCTLGMGADYVWSYSKHNGYACGLYRRWGDYWDWIRGPPGGISGQSSSAVTPSLVHSCVQGDVNSQGLMNADVEVYPSTSLLIEVLSSGSEGARDDSETLRCNANCSSSLNELD